MGTPTNQITGEVVISQGKEGPLRRRHPWVYEAAVAEVRGTPEPGALVVVVDGRGRLLGQGYYNPHSQIRVRMLAWNDQPLDEAFWRNRLARAISAREPVRGQSDGLRLVNAESDGLPGLVVDQYREFLVLQSLTLGIERRKQLLVSLLSELVKPAGIYERSDVGVRALEGLPGASGPVWGQTPPPKLVIREGEVHFQVDVAGGHKTGFYLDQRENRLLAHYLAAGKEVLDVCCYTGGFGVHKRFDLVILDPPKFARSVGELPGALRGYRDLNRVAVGLLRPGGLLLTFTCSGRVGWEAFQRAVALAAADSQREVQVLRRLSQAEDHPVVRGLFLRVW